MDSIYSTSKSDPNTFIEDREILVQTISGLGDTFDCNPDFCDFMYSLATFIQKLTSSGLTTLVGLAWPSVLMRGARSLRAQYSA
jgi:hypothetical protein